MLKIKLNSDQEAIRPGSLLTGTIEWEMNRVPDSISASLTWSTEGKGDEDGDSVIAQTWHPQSESGSQAFQWEMPRGPLSLDGKLIRIRWNVEGSSESPDEEASVPIVLSHLQRPIILKAS